jgi:hypothetical protein
MCTKLGVQLYEEGLLNDEANVGGNQRPKHFVHKNFDA